MTQAATVPVLDLSTCDKEPIRTPGSIQPHGFLLTLAPDLAVLQASANLGVRPAFIQRYLIDSRESGELRGCV
ncbi:hypothetical protein ACEN88_20625, partial [Massilia sp. CT11-108]|uniref:hypothetical protein n=1 Tax=Massilia sp. CT11-108 TaxID=3393900 RepID=UPI0039A66CE9